ncbi:methyltransferase domain-containing protein [Marinactinospora thermotolerans]|uniref:Methylase involved in ubiquinone/menaquinone biosynthesis n=1 Tax=Marinactinospora thermotolerans DSM 45154 TaxID=1122192 RepID=A0A1T4PQ88_9ACTN|nr:methyltransferase domain-containing protein [Marinactinospora thermotolerans]SJZ93742.1 Methylase involved in ubiquinone/menaquinone biosynthesis [Marinactinospora thermotolerans DSM 45154]
MTSPHHPPGVPDNSSAPVATPRPRLWSERNMAALYDLLVVHGTYWAMWGVRWPVIAELYRANVSGNHLELAPGTGYLLNRVGMPSETPRLHLLDLHEGPLEVSARRLARFQPVKLQGDVFQPFPLAEDSVDSVAAGMMLHCLPGDSITAKAVVFDNVARVLTPGGRFFGCTVLARDVPMNWFGRLSLRKVNDKQVFCNLGDSLADLRSELEKRFDDVSVTVHGSVGLWQASAR